MIQSVTEQEGELKAVGDYGTTIRARRKALGMNQFQLADKAGVSRNAVAGWETGHSRPDLDTIPSLCRALGISADEFFGLGKNNASGESRLLKLFWALDRRDREAMLWQMEAVLAGRKIERSSQSREIPIPGYVSVFSSDLGAAAGTGCLLGETQGETVFLLADEETERADEVITVSGDSMAPTFLNGDRVLVAHTDRLRPGEIGIFLVNGEGYIKEYRPDGLHSHNPAYRTMTFRDGEDVRCAGKVIAKLKPEQIPDEEQLRLIEEAEQGRKRGERS